MAITSLDGAIAAPKQKLALTKTAARTSIAAAWFSVIDLAGDPGAGVLAGTSVSAGVVPTDATAGCPPVNAFGGGNLGYLSKVEFGSSVACRIKLFDLVWKSGAHAFNAAQTLTGQPSFAGRLPGTDYKGLEIWVEQVTAATGNQAVAVTYTKEDATTGSRTTGAVGIAAAPTVGRCWQLPLQSGDAGVSRIDTVTGTVATVGTFNVLVLRPLWSARVRVANDGDVHDLLKTGMPQVFDDSAFFMLVSADSTSTGLPDLELTISNG